MKTFFKIVFGSMLGCLFSFILIFIIILIIFSSVSTFTTKKPVEIKENSILHLKFDERIVERTDNNPFKNIDFGNIEPIKELSVSQIVECINAAKDDKKITGIFIEPGFSMPDFTTLQIIRDALKEFKASGKFIYAYAEAYSQKSYFVASVADSIFLNPKGVVDFRGLSAQLFFLKGAFSKLEIEPQVIRHGKYKSAVEPFTLDKMSEENRQQYKELINSIWNNYLTTISNERSINIDSLNSYAEKIAIRNANDAMRLGFVDGLLYKDDVLTLLKNKSKTKEKINELEFVDLYNYNKYSANEKDKSTGKDKIAIIYAIGEIVSGKGGDDMIGSETLSKAIRDARLDDDVKAVVLRVNSPGGSALASEVIWREVELTKKTKPVVVSMGSVAASGGYYISCAANKIVAQQTTITGSIGVFGVMFNLDKFFKNKLGVTFDVVKTNQYADMPTFTRPMTDFEKKVLQQSIEEIYDTFITRVAEGRNMTKSKVDSIGQGRIFSGIDAMSVGLVDTIGDLQTSIKIAAKLAKIDKYKTIELPKQKDLFESFFEQLLESSTKSKFKEQLLKEYPFIQAFENIKTNEVFLTRLPYNISIE